MVKIPRKTEMKTKYNPILSLKHTIRKATVKYEEDERLKVLISRGEVSQGEGPSPTEVLNQEEVPSLEDDPSLMTRTRNRVLSLK